MLTKNSHMSYSDRLIIETGIENGSTKQAIATTLGKDKSTIGKEIKLHRFLAYKCNLPLECANYKRCKHERYCTLDCSDYVPFKCTRRDKSPGACNGCGNYRSCRYDKYRYSAFDAQHDYQMTLTSSRQGVNATVNDIKQLGELLLPLLKKGQSIYSILQSHREIKLSEKTIYNYIENGVFQDVGVSISAIDLKRVVRRKMSKQKRNTYKPRKDNRYLTGRKYSDFLIYMEKNPNAKVVEMDTVYNDVSNGPFLQTFKFREYDLLICIYQTVKDSLYMLDGILLLEKILGKEMFEKEVEVILTDRGSEFVLAEEAEIREDGTRRTRMFYCDSMASLKITDDFMIDIQLDGKGRILKNGWQTGKRVSDITGEVVDDDFYNDDTITEIPIDNIVFDDYFPLHYWSGLSAGSFEELIEAEPDSVVYVPNYIPE